MRVSSVCCAVVAAPSLIAVSVAAADTVNLNPVADAFLAATLPNNNYGAAGALAVSGTGAANGEFQSVLRFDTAAAVASFNASMGAGQWSIQSITLRLTATSPNNPLFNTPAAGQFGASWLQNDSWVEGTGNTNSPAPTGVMFGSLPSLTSGGDEALGVFAFSGATSGSFTYTLDLGAGFVADAAAGGAVSLRLFAIDPTVSLVLNSRNFPTVGSRPELSITAVPSPAGAAVMGSGGAALLLASRRRRRYNSA